MAYAMQQTELHEYVAMGYTNIEIAEMMGVSKTTVKRRRSELCIRKKDTAAAISDYDLDEAVTSILQQSPTLGGKMVTGALLSKGINVQRERIRESIRRVDPEGVERRKKSALKRRVYSVPGPNALWHMDGNHKLIRWRLVIHGAIDGFSRIPVFLVCSTNNKADTVLKAFLQAITDHGLPERVRSDMGAENTKVCDFMLGHPLRGRGSFIVGKSVHNQRIERLWRDVFQSCLITYYRLFSQLEDEGKLDPTSDIDLFSLHYIYQPVINHHLTSFKDAYANHKIRTANNRTPLQIWTEGKNAGYPIDVLDENELAEYGIDDGDIEELGHDDNHEVNVPDTIQLTDEQLAAIQRHFNRNENMQAEERVAYYTALRDYVLSL